MVGSITQLLIFDVVIGWFRPVSIWIKGLLIIKLMAFPRLEFEYRSPS